MSDPAGIEKNGSGRRLRLPHQPPDLVAEEVGVCKEDLVVETEDDEPGKVSYSGFLFTSR